MISKLWIRKTFTAGLCVATLTAYSMVGLANTGKIAGEILVSGNSINGEAPAVTVNGVAAKSGRSIFSSSIITTPEGTTAILNLGKAGKVQLAENSSLAISFDDKSITGELTAGKLSVLGAPTAVSVKTVDGRTVSVNSGETVTASGAAQDDDDKASGGGSNWWIFAVIIGGAAAGILYAATQSNNKASIGGGGTVVSPTR